MTEQLSSPIHDTPTQPAVAEFIHLISAIIGSDNAERMLREYQAGQAIVAEDERLKLDTDDCIQHQQLVAEQIEKNKQRRQELAPQLEAALQNQANLRSLIGSLTKFAYSEPSVEHVVAPQEVQRSLVIPPLPAHDPTPAATERSLDEFCGDVMIQRSLGKRAIVRGRLKSVVKGN